MIPVSHKKIKYTIGRASKMIIIHVENESFDELEILITWVKGGHIMQTGGTPSGQSGCRRSPGGECFAPLGALPLREGGRCEALSSRWQP